MSLQPGESLLLGSYSQGENGEVQPISWRILKVQDGNALLLCEKGLEAAAFQTQRDVDFSWSTCDLHDWLNGAFFDNSFTKEEQEKVLLEWAGEVYDPVTAKPLGKHLPVIPEKVFLLSKEEVESLFPEEQTRICEPTDMAVVHGVERHSFTGGCWWWLRSQGYSKIFVNIVYDFGFASDFGYDVYIKTLAVRPAVWIHF